MIVRRITNSFNGCVFEINMKNGFSLKLKTFIFLLVVSVLLIFLSKFGKLGGLDRAMTFVFSPIAKTFQGYSNGAYGFFDTIRSIEKFKQENSILKKENAEMVFKISVLKETERENEILRRQLDFSDKLCTSGICLNWKIAKVIGRSPNNYEKFIIIDLGKDQGIAVNQAAVYSGGALVGKITEVYENSAKVVLITSADSSVNSITQSTRSNGIVKGKYSTGVKLEMINQNEELTDGDFIITSGLEEGIPKGLLIGKISNIKESANKVFKEANVDLFVDFNRIEDIFVVN